MDILDKVWQDVLAIKKMFDSPGWIQFEEHIKNLLAFEKAYLEKVTKNAIKPENINDFNFHLAKKQTLEQILMIKDNLLDENSPPEGEQNTSETKQ